jgi:phospholipid/cholesterol/gamma-HCH transport system ATP-binding protein
VLRIKGLSRAFGEKRVLCGVDLDVPTSQLVGVIGPSGGGKSTLLKILASTCRADSGSVLFSSEASAHDIALMFQEGALFDSLSVYDNVAFPLVRGRVPTTLLPKSERASVCEKVSEILARVGLTKAANKMPAQLSGGMRRRVSLARALVCRPAYLLLDDPTSGLDPVASSVIMDLIVELHSEYRPTTLIVSHDLRRLLPVVEQVVALFHGAVAFQGTLSELRANPDPQIRGFVSCRFDMEV